MSEPRNLGQSVRAVRVAVDLTIGELFDLTGIGVTRIFDLELGRLEPTPETLSEVRGRLLDGVAMALQADRWRDPGSEYARESTPGGGGRYMPPEDGFGICTGRFEPTPDDEFVSVEDRHELVSRNGSHDSLVMRPFTGGAHGQARTSRCVVARQRGERKK